MRANRELFASVRAVDLASRGRRRGATGLHRVPLHSRVALLLVVLAAMSCSTDTEPAPEDCCRICAIPCGDYCASSWDACDEPPGCACLHVVDDTPAPPPSPPPAPPSDNCRCTYEDGVQNCTCVL